MSQERLEVRQARLWTEIRVHGVSGTPPENTLDLTSPSQVDRIAGDENTGFYARRANSPVVPGSELPDGGELEAFSWGALTSGATGAWARALWLLLLPFALVNVAYWARPRMAKEHSPDAARVGHTFVRDRSGAAVVRLAGVLLTSLFASALCATGLNVFALQCLGLEAQDCAGLNRFLGFARASYWAETPRVVLLGMLVPILGIALLWFLSKMTWAKYERVVDPAERLLAERDAESQDFNAHLLQQPSMWNGVLRLRRLRRLHVAAALLTLVGYVSLTLWNHEGSEIFARIGAITALTVLALVLLTVWSQSGDSPDCYDERQSRLSTSGVHWLPWIAVFLVAAQGGWLLIATFEGSIEPDAYSNWLPAVIVIVSAAIVLFLCVHSYLPSVPATAVIAIVICSVGGALAIALAEPSAWIVMSVAVAAVGPVIAAVIHRSSDSGRERWMWSGAAPGMFLGAGLFVGLLYGTAIVLGAAAFLHGGVNALVEPVRSESLPPTFRWFSAALLPFIVAAAVAVGVFWALSSRLREAPALNSGNPRAIPGSTVLRLRAARLRRAETVLGVTGVLAAADLSVVAVGSMTGEVPDDSGIFNTLMGIGTAGCVAFAAVLVLLGRMVNSQPKIRRGVGVLWDLSGFWPRAAHPFAPPCYAERAVPEMFVRCEHVLRNRDRLLLSGHSLGVIISVAALLRLPAVSQQRTAMLSYGSQLRQYFGRGFPGALGPSVVGNAPASRLPPFEYEYPWPGTDVSSATVSRTLAAVLGVRADSESPRWVNLYRLTDPLGFPAFAPVGKETEAGLVDRRASEVHEFPGGDPRDPVVETHSAYTLTPEYVVNRGLLLP